MIQSSVLGIPIPEPTDPDQVPYHLGLLVAGLESYSVGRWDTTGARDADITTPVVGMITAVGSRHQAWDGGQWKDIGLGLPDPVSADGPGAFDGSTAVTSSSFSALPTPVQVSVQLPARALVAVTYSGWLAGATSSDVRLAVTCSGATSIGTGTPGEALASGVVYTSHSMTRWLVLEGGSTTIAARAMRVGSQSVYANYVRLAAAPIRWA